MLLKRLLNLNDNFIDSMFFDEVFTSFMKGSFVLDLVSDCVAEIQAELLLEQYISDPIEEFC